MKPSWITDLSEYETAPPDDMILYYPSNGIVKNIELMEKTTCFKVMEEGEVVLAVKFLCHHTKDIDKCLVVFQKTSFLGKVRETAPVLADPLRKPSDLDILTGMYDIPLVIMHIAIERRYVSNIYLKIDYRWYNKVRTGDIKYEPQFVNNI